MCLGLGLALIVYGYSSWMSLFFLFLLQNTRRGKSSSASSRLDSSNQDDTSSNGKGRIRSGSVSSHRDDRFDHSADELDGGLSGMNNNNSSAAGSGAGLARGAQKLGLDLYNLQAIELDESRLFLLQTAFRSLGNFFSLASNATPATAAGSAKSLFQQFSSIQQQQQQLAAPSLGANVDILRGLGTSFSLGFPGANSAANNNRMETGTGT